MAADPQSLVTSAQCLPCIPPGDQIPVLISLFAQAAGGSTDPQTLMNNARCLSCIPGGMQKPVLISILNQISNGS